MYRQANLVEALRDSRTRLAFGASVQPRRFAAWPADRPPERVSTRRFSTPEAFLQASHRARNAILPINTPYTLKTHPKPPHNTPTTPPKPSPKALAKAPKLDFSLWWPRPDRPHQAFSQASHRATNVILAINTPYTLTNPPKSPHNTPTTLPQPSTNHRQHGKNSIFSQKNTKISQVMKNFWLGKPSQKKNQNVLLHFLTIQSSEIPKMA